MYPRRFLKTKIELGGASTTFRGFMDRRKGGKVPGKLSVCLYTNGDRNEA
jgi:hypothetical protein